MPQEELHHYGVARVLRKHVDTVHTASSLTLKERHLANVLLANAMKVLDEGDESDELIGKYQYQIYTPKIMRALFGNQRKDRHRLTTLLDGLRDKSIKWAYTDEDGSRMGSSGWIGAWEYRGDTTVYSYPPELIEKILDPAIYARLNYSNQNTIRRTHSQALYENCARYRDHGTTKLWSISTFRGLMGLADKPSYAEFRILNNRVIKPAVKEVNEKTEIRVEPVLVRRGHNVVKIRFMIEENTDYTGPPMPMPGSNGADAASMAIVESRPEIYESLLQFGVNHKSAVECLRKWDDQRIRENLRLVSDRVRNGKSRIKNIAAYAMNAIRDDYRLENADLQQVIDFDQNDPERVKAERIRAVKATLAEFENQMLPEWQVQEWLAKTPAHEQDAAWSSWEDEITTHNPWLMRQVAQKPSSPMVQSTWRAWIRKNQIGEATTAEKLACARANSLDLNDLLLVAGEQPLPQTD
ncbi:MAG: replication initiation protein [Salinisphaeraceae bacterium]